MIRTLGLLALRLALCGAVTWAVWRSLGETGMVMVLPIFGVALARPLLDLASDLRHAMRQATWREVEGRHYAFRGVTVHVVTDADHRRWIRLADVRAVIGHSASEAALQVTYPRGWRRLGSPPAPHLADDALLAHLRKLRDPVAIRFARWVDREIGFAARRERERLGIRLEALDFRSSD